MPRKLQFWANTEKRMEQSVGLNSIASGIDGPGRRRAIECCHEVF